MPRFGKYQWYTSKDLQSLGKVGKLYASLVGYTQIGGYGRSLWFRRILRMKDISFENALEAVVVGSTYSIWQKDFLMPILQG